MAESHTTKSKPWPQWGRYSHYKIGPRPCIWLLFLDPCGLNSWFWRPLRKLKSGFFLDLDTVLSPKKWEKQKCPGFDFVVIWWYVGREYRFLVVCYQKGVKTKTEPGPLAMGGFRGWAVVLRIFLPLQNWTSTKLIPKTKKKPTNSATTKLESQKSKNLKRKSHTFWHSQVFLRFPFCKALKSDKIWSGFTLGHPKTGAPAPLFCRENGRGDLRILVVEYILQGTREPGWYKTNDSNTWNFLYVFRYFNI